MGVSTSMCCILTANVYLNGILLWVYTPKTGMYSHTFHAISTLTPNFSLCTINMVFFSWETILLVFLELIDTSFKIKVLSSIDLQRIALYPSTNRKRVVPCLKLDGLVCLVVGFNQHCEFRSSNQFTARTWFVSSVCTKCKPEGSFLLKGNDSIICIVANDWTQETA